MKTKLLSILILISLLAGCEQSKWREFISNEGHFRVLLPGTPSKAAQTISSPIGPFYQQVYSLSTGDAMYQITFLQLTDSLAHLSSPTEHVKSARNQIIKSPPGLFISESAISGNGYQGIELKFSKTLPSGASAIFTHHIFFIGNTLYQLTVGTNIRNNQTADAEQFLNSFKPIISSNEDSKWQEFRSVACRFSIYMPGTPIKSTEQINYDSSPLEMNSFTLETSDAIYIVSYVKFDNSKMSKKDKGNMLDNIRSGAIDKAIDHKIDESVVNRNRYQVTEFKLKIQNETGENRLFVNDVYFTNNAFYQVMVLHEIDAATEEKAKQFLESFEMIEEHQ